jgi:hypothetical protein
MLFHVTFLQVIGFCPAITSKEIAVFVFTCIHVHEMYIAHTHVLLSYFSFRPACTFHSVT